MSYKMEKEKKINQAILFTKDMVEHNTYVSI